MKKSIPAIILFILTALCSQTVLANKHNYIDNKGRKLYLNTLHNTLSIRSVDGAFVSTEHIDKYKVIEIEQSYNLNDYRFSKKLKNHEVNAYQQTIEQQGGVANLLLSKCEELLKEKKEILENAQRLIAAEVSCTLKRNKAKGLIFFQ